MWIRRAVGLVVVAAMAAGCSSGSDTATTGGSSPTTAIATGGTTGVSTPAGATAPGARPGAKGGAPIAKYAGFTHETYADQQNWLCGPGAAANDRCLTADLTTTVVQADGSTQVTDAKAATAPAFDCFYVYPTVNFGPGGNDTAMAADTSNEDSVIRNQAARFREQCRVYAPLYRQMMLSGSADMAYGDVSASFKHYMAQWNQGRPVMLIGHSQGSGMLARVLKDEFDADPELRGRLIAAYLLGGGATVAEGKTTGGTFENIPVCTDPQQNGCVIAYNSVAADGPDDDRTRWGGAPAGQLKVCTNPGALAGGSAAHTPIMPRSGTYLKGKGEDAITTPYVELPDAVEAQCTVKAVPGRDGNPSPHHTLDWSLNTAAGDARDIERIVTPGPSFWALHIQETQLAFRSLLELLEQQTAGLR